jgi:inactivated superfamily I helicase
MTQEEKLLEKLRRIEALFAGTDAAGERDAAAAAAKRLRERLNEFRRVDPPVEYKFTMSDSWSRRLLTALLRRYGIEPYRYSGQRYTTVMALVPKSFVDQTLWPEFQQLSEVLRAYLDEVTNRVISEGIFGDVSEARERKAIGPSR